MVSKELWASLSAARFILATWVLFAHTENFGTAARAMPVPSSNALVAVYSFLAISGFSIHHSISVQPLKYAGRRVSRILPIHLVSFSIAILAYAVCGFTLFDGHENAWPRPSVGEWLGCLLLLQAILPIATAVLFPSWSLSVEVMYYALAPLFRRTVLMVPILLVVVSCGFCVLRPYISPLYIGSDTYGLSAGAMLWAWLTGWLAYVTAGKVWTYVLCVGAGCFAIWIDPLLSGFFNYGCWITIITLLRFGENVRIGQRMQGLAHYLGELSYPLYIIHYPLLFLVYNMALRSIPNWNCGVLQVCIVGTTTIMVYEFIDKPCRSWIATFLSDGVPTSNAVGRGGNNGSCL